MKKLILLLFIGLLSAFVGNNEAKACHALALINPQQNLGATNVQVTASSTAPTCGCGVYWLDVEVRCMNEPFDGAPFDPTTWFGLNTYPYFQSATMLKPNCAVQQYPWVTIPFAGLCPGMTYQYRMRENNNGNAGPWSTPQTFVVPGTTLPLIVDATSPNINICAGQCTDLNSSVIQGCGLAATYTWDNGAGTGANVNVCPAVTTTYTVSVVEQCSGFTDQASITINVVPPAVPGTAAISATNICSGDPVNINLAGSAGTIDWQTAPGAAGPWTNTGSTATTFNDNPTTSTCYRAEVTGCAGVVYSNVVCVTVDPPPLPNFAAPNVCAGTATAFTNTSGTGGGPAITGYAWDFGDGNTSTAQNPNHTYAGPGTYNVTLTITNATGCTANVTQAVTVDPLPTANFTSVIACPGANSTFTDQSAVGGGGVINQWAWDFGDGNTSTAQNPTNAYAASGNYNVTLTVTTTGGCTNTITIPVTVPEIPVANFTANQVCQGTATNFTDMSTIGVGAITGWNWDFGDGNTSTAQNPNHTYAAGGNYNVTLTVTTGGGCTHNVTLPVTVDNTPAANFTFPQPWCLANAIAYTDASNGNGGTINQWAWDFGDGNTSATQNPTHTYTTAGPHNVSLTVTTTNGCTHTLVQAVTLEPDPTPDFVFNPGCPGLPSAFTDASTAGGTATINQWAWDFGDGNTSTAQNPTNSYTTAGNYNVTLTVTSSTGCTNTVVIPVTVPSGPAVDFTYSPTCDGQAMTFTDATVVPGGTTTAWAWDYGDGNTGNGNPSNHTYAAAGNYNVTLTATTNSGCTGSVTLPVTVNPNPIADFTFPNPFCAADPLPFTDASNGNGGTINQWDWDFGDGGTDNTQNPTHNYGGALGPFNVTLTVTTTDGCTGNVTYPVTLEPAPTPNFNFNVDCPGFATTFADASVAGGTANINSWTWDFGDGNTSTQQNPSNIYANAGTYNVQLDIVSSTGCSNTITIPVDVPYEPVAEINMQNVCDGVVGTFNDASTVNGSTIVDWDWDMGDGTQYPNQQNVNHAYGANTYNVVLTVTSAQGCIDDTTMSVTIFPNPIANFSPTTVCEGYPTVMNDLTNANGGVLDTWNWDIGDDGSVEYNTLNPTHSFPAAGTYNVELMVNTVNGCADSIVIPVTVDPTPVPDFNFVVACPTLPTTFTDASAIGGAATLTNWSWDFGDGNTSTAQNPTNAYAGPGTYNVKLIVTGSTGCIDSVTYQVVIPEIPVASFTLANVCDGVAGNFNDASTVGGGAVINSWDWDMESDATIDYTTQNVVHTYPTNNTYAVHLTVTSDQGCIDDTIANVTIYPNPTADFTAQAVCDNEQMSFVDNSNGNGGTINQWSWDMDGDAVEDYNVQNPGHLFPTDGTYNIDLTVTTTNGCSGTVNLPVTVHPVPTANFNLTNICEGQNANFTDASVVGTGAITGWDWDFGNGNTSTQQNPTEAYTTENVYTVELITTTDQGCTDTISQTIDVYPNPVADFSPQAVCLNVPVNFTDQSTVSNTNTTNNIVNWDWDLGDGTTYTGIQNPPTHVYNPAGAYTIDLIVTTDHGCTDNISVVLDIYEKPVADIITADNCVDLQANFTDNSTVTGAAIADWEWDFGDGNTATAQNPSHQYGAAGTYTVQLIVTSTFGCEDTATAQITQFPIPVANFTHLDECVYDSLCFTNTSNVAAPSTMISQVWSFGDGSPLNTAQNPCHLYAAEGTYNVQLISTSDHGCADDTTITVTVHPQPTVDFTGTSVCINQPPSMFTNNSNIASGSILQWNWDFGDGSSPSALQDPTHTYGAAGVYNVTLIGISDQGCQDTIVRSVSVFDKPIAQFGSDITEGCDPLEVDFMDLSTPNANNITNWQWDFGNGTTSNLENPVGITFVGSGTLSVMNYDVSLIVTNDNGCSDTVSTTSYITVHPDPIADFTFTPEETDEHNAQIDFTNMSTNGESYLWDFGDGNSSADINPGHFYQDTGVFEVMLIAYTQYGCADTAYGYPQINPVPEIYVPNAFTPDGDGKNDVFMPVLYAYDNAQYEFYVFDRWGQIIFESFSPNYGWDGTYKGQQATEKTDVFVWKVVIRPNNSGDTKEYVGHVTLLK